VSHERTWLANAVLYQIYPQSYDDANGDGIGDFAGVQRRLDYLQWLGIDAIWFNPCFVSPHRDAGYDVADYLQVDPRYGTNDELVTLIDEAANRDIKILLDLVVGHTSDQHPWFLAEAEAEAERPRAEAEAGPSAEAEADPRCDRYIWADSRLIDQSQTGVLGTSAWVASPGRRSEHYLKNFFDSQPALNFGYARSHPDEPWRQGVDAPGPRRNVASMKEVMGFWLDRGVAGFRVDMAFSLVKDDPSHGATMALWRELRQWLDEHHPHAVLIPEGVEPDVGSTPVFDADFFLVIGDQHRVLFNNEGAGNLPWHDGQPCYFDGAAAGDFGRYLDMWQSQRQARPNHPVLLATADHDFSRLVCGARDQMGAAVALVFLFTWGSVPSLYYGDEIGMRFIPGLPDVEGSECFPGYYNRAGARTPMQWDDTANAGFSSAPAHSLYLPIDPDPRRPHVASARDDDTSLLHLVRALIKIRKHLAGEPEVLHAGYPLMFRRDDHLVVLNPSASSGELTFAEHAMLRQWLESRPVLERGTRWHDHGLQCDPHSFVVLAHSPEHEGRRMKADA